MLRLDARARRRDRQGTRALEPVPFPKRSSGVLLHVTSLPSGRLDEEAYRFVDWLVEAGQSWWQLLPLHIPDSHGSPYASRSAFAGHEGLLAAPGSRYHDSGEGDDGAPQGSWLEEWVRFAGEPERRAQTRFQREWLALKRYANERGIRLIGDIPLYVAGDSCDALAHPGALRPLGRRRCGTVAEPPGGPTLGHAGVRLAGPRRRGVRLVAGTPGAGTRAVRPAADRPLPRPRQVLGAASRRGGSVERVLGRGPGDRVLRCRPRAARRPAADPRGPSGTSHRMSGSCAMRSGCPA